MGLDPNDDTFEAGDECTVCVDELFGGVTPKTVLAIVQDIVMCPGVPPLDPMPNGSFNLTQLANPCHWGCVGPGGYSYTWTLHADRSDFAIETAHTIMFFSRVMEICFDAFSNQADCAGLLTITHEGYVTVWWGPDIPPPC